VLQIKERAPTLSFDVFTLHLSFSRSLGCINDDFDLIIELETFAKNIKKIIWAIDFFFSFLKIYDERRIHNLLTFMLDFEFKSLRLIFSFIGHEHEVAIIKEYDRKSLFPMLLKFHHHLHPLFELKISLFIESMMIGIWTFLRWMWLTPINLQMFVHKELLNFINIHYYKSWLFKRFN
jgi:hypothetical protein